MSKFDDYREGLRAKQTLLTMNRVERLARLAESSQDDVIRRLSAENYRRIVGVEHTCREQLRERLQAIHGSGLTVAEIKQHVEQHRGQPTGGPSTSAGSADDSTGGD